MPCSTVVSISLTPRLKPSTSGASRPAPNSNSLASPTAAYLTAAPFSPSSNTTQPATVLSISTAPTAPSSGSGASIISARTRPPLPNPPSLRFPLQSQTSLSQQPQRQPHPPHLPLSDRYRSPPPSQNNPPTAASRPGSSSTTPPSTNPAGRRRECASPPSPRTRVSPTP